MKLRYLSSALLVAVSLFVASCDETEEYSIATGETVSLVTTGDATVTAVSATLSGTVSGLTGAASASYTVGAYYGVDEDPINNGTRKSGSLSDGAITVSLTDLTPGTTYYYAIYVALQGTVYYYGDVKTFIATSAKVVTEDASDITSCRATFGASTSGTDGLEYSVGVKIALSESDATSGTAVELGEVSALLPGTTYYYVAYIQSGSSYVYGETKSLTTEVQTMDYVDLGLSVLWASCNIGAEVETEAGAKFGFGDVTALKTSTSLGAYASEDISATSSDVAAVLGIDAADVAKVSQIPTSTQVRELIDNTTQTWETVDGVSGIRFTATNGNSIFMPAAGYREGEDVSENGAGYYWSGTVNATNTDYAKSLIISESGAEVSASTRYLGFSVRSVREVDERWTVEGVAFDNAKLITGNIQGKGDFRLEIYNAYGNTIDNPGINTSDVAFSTSISVTFKLTGIQDDAASYQCYFCFADGTWGVTNWDYVEGASHSCIVKGDGVYTVTLAGAGSGLNVCCVDILGLAAVETEVTATVIGIYCDELTSITTEGNVEFYNSKIITGDIEGYGNYRAEIYNVYGSGTANDPGLDADEVTFSNSLSVTFTVSGMVSDAVSYQCYLCFADGTWSVSNWGYVAGASHSCLVTGNGTYTLSISGSGSGLNVFCIDILSVISAEPDINIVINSITAD